MARTHTYTISLSEMIFIYHIYLDFTHHHTLRSKVSVHSKSLVCIAV